jgi:hypothetical protein
MASMGEGYGADMRSCIPKLLPIIEDTIRQFAEERTP